MFDTELYVSITGVQHYYGLKPFRVGTYVLLKKEPGNDHDDEAIMVLIPLLGKAGYVANSPYTTASGTLSAGRIYDRIPGECAAVVRFIANDMIIARVFPDKKLKMDVDVRLEERENLFSSFRKKE